MSEHTRIARTREAPYATRTVHRLPTGRLACKIRMAGRNRADHRLHVHSST